MNKYHKQTFQFATRRSFKLAWPVHQCLYCYDQLCCDKREEQVLLKWAFEQSTSLDYCDTET